MKISIKPFIHDTLTTTTSNEKIFILEDFEAFTSEFLVNLEDIISSLLLVMALEGSTTT